MFPWALPLEKSGRTIIIEKGTIVTAAYDSARFGFSVESGAGVLMKDSEITRWRWGPDIAELGDDATILS